MLGVNYVLLGGRFTRDPYVQHLENKKTGEPLTSVQFRLAVSEDYKDASGNYVTNFISCKAIGGPAVFIEKYCKTGTPVIVQGRIRSEDYTTKDGERKFGQPVQVEKITFAESASAPGGRETAPTAPDQAQQATAPVQNTAPAEQPVQTQPEPVATPQDLMVQPVQKPEPVVMPQDAIPVQSRMGEPQNHPVPAEQPVQTQPVQQNMSEQAAPQAPPFGAAPTFDGGLFNGFNGNR